MVKPRRSKRHDQKGYMLLAVMLLITVMLIFLSIEAPRIAQQIKRDKEEELVHRGKEYAIAIRKFFHKNGNYPTSLEQLEDTNHIRYLRKRYKDPMTGEANWKVIHVGEAEIPMPKNNNPGLQGSGNPGLQGSTNPGQTPTATAGLNTSQGLSGGTPNTPAGNQLGAVKTTNISNGLGGTGQTIGGGGIIGVASVSNKEGIKEFNDKNTYDEWYFVYDPRLEQTAAAFGGSASAGILVASPRAGGAAAPGPGLAPSASPSPTPVPQSR
jgi:type II secretory pathway pseudopilin PulG